MFLAFGFGLEFAELVFSGSLFFLEFLGSLFGFSKLTLFLLSEFFETFLCRGLFCSSLFGGFLATALFFFQFSLFFDPLRGFPFGSLKLLTEAADVGVFGYLVLQFACFGGLLCGLAVFSVPAFLSLTFLLLLGFLPLFTLPRSLRGSFTFLFGLVLVASLLFRVAFLSGFVSVLGLLVLA